MRRPGSDKVYETCPDPFGSDVLIRPARRKRYAPDTNNPETYDLETEVLR